MISGGSDQARLLLAAAVAGLILGVGLAFLPGSSSAPPPISLESSRWQDYEIAVDRLNAALQLSRQWSRGSDAVSAGPGEEVTGAPARPGVFAHLKLVAILREPEHAAVLKAENMPESLRSVMVSSAGEDGMWHFREGDTVASGWTVSEISESHLTIERSEDGELVSYQLFEWELAEGRGRNRKRGNR